MTTTPEHLAMPDLEADKEVIRAFVDAWNTRDFIRFDEVMGAHAVLHVAGGDVACDHIGTRTIAEEWTTAVPDWRFEILEVVAEGDLVVAHLPYSGTHRGAIAGVDATGRTCTVDEIVIFRLAGGKIVEAWEVYDEAGMWRQLGLTRLP